jgi:hypothetical protein
VVALVAVGGIATIASAEILVEADQSDSIVEFEFLEEQGLLVYWLSGDAPVEDGEPVDCVSFVDTGDDTDDPTADGTDEATDDAMEPPDGCIVVDVTGPNGQINHGTVMSSVVHSIRDLEYDGPRGHIVREFARSGVGKADVTDVDDVDDESGDESDDDGPKPEKKEKKPKRDDHPGRGNGRK